MSPASPMMKWEPLYPWLGRQRGRWLQFFLRLQLATCVSQALLSWLKLLSRPRYCAVPCPNAVAHIRWRASASASCSAVAIPRLRRLPEANIPPSQLAALAAICSLPLPSYVCPIPAAAWPGLWPRPSAAAPLPCAACRAAQRNSGIAGSGLSPAPCGSPLPVPEGSLDRSPTADRGPHAPPYKELP